MPNIFHQSVEDILKAATPEQRLMWNYIFLRWGERIPISQLFYVGSSAGTEFLTYSASKLYVCYSLRFAGSNVAQSSVQNIGFYNELNALHFVNANNYAFWDATAANFVMGKNESESTNLYFSRIVINSVASQIRFIGYRISI